MEDDMFDRIPAGAFALAAALLMMITPAPAHDESKYPDWSGMWRRPPGVGIQWDETKPPGLAQQAPLKPEFQKVLEDSIAEQKAGGQGGDFRVRCISNGMPRLMTIIRQHEIFIMPSLTLVIYENNLPRRIYTDGRDFTAEDNTPSYAGYSIGKWLDTDGDGRYETLEVETRNFKGPRNYEQSGIPLHPDGQSIVKERLYLDKADRNTMLNEITVIDNALTRPWTVVKHYRRQREHTWYEDLCSENNNHVQIGNEGYMLSADGYLMPTKKDQSPPDLRYFNIKK
jgi:hypothetical protein